MEFITFLCIIGWLLFSASIYVIVNLTRKVELLEEKYEDTQIYMDSLSKVIGESSIKIKELDEKGVFKGDDEIGWFFKSLLYIQEILNEYNLNESQKTNKQKENNNYEYIPYNPKISKEETQAKNY